MILNVDFALKLSNYTSWKVFMSEMKLREFVHDTTYSVQPPYIAGHSL